MNILLFLSTISLLTSCNGQTSNQKKNSDQFIKGDTIKELGKSIMVIYQDKKNVYWFGSWETGVYKYDGKELVNFTTKHGLIKNRIDEIKEDGFGNIYFGCFAIKFVIMSRTYVQNVHYFMLPA